MSASDDTARVLVTPEELVGFAIDGKYRLDAILGGGGMGVVYRTTQQNLNREIAIKLLKIDDATETSRLGRFQREIDIVAQLTHPNIVRVFDSGRDSELGVHYIAMELVDGVSLDEVMRGRRLAPALAIEIAHQVCAALTEPHRMGIIHRDIKPANILLATQSDDAIGVKVVDFGIARGVSAEASSGKITTTGVVVGSPMYMAPEVARGETLDARTDLYSLGVLLYEMLTGDTPFRGSTPVAIMLRHAVDEPPSLGEAVDDDFHFPELVALVDSMLSKDRRERPSDAKEVLRRLETIRRDHNLARVTIDGSKPPMRALDPFTLTVDHSDVEEPQTDAFSPTTPYGETEAPTESDAFSGWLVTEAARRRLRGDGTEVEALHVETEEHADPGKRRVLGIVAGVVVVALIVATVAALFVGEGRPDPGAPDESDEATIEAAPIAIGNGAGEEQVPEPQPTAVAAPTDEDAGAEDAAGSVDTSFEEPEEAVERPTTKTDETEGADENPKTTDRGPARGPDERAEPQGATNGGSDDFKEGMKWLHEK